MYLSSEKRVMPSHCLAVPLWVRSPASIHLNKIIFVGLRGVLLGRLFLSPGPLSCVVAPPFYFLASYNSTRHTNTNHPGQVIRLEEQCWWGKESSPIFLTQSKDLDSWCQ
uniref:Vacuolar protein sorting/targeting protein 10 n=1 Tax=Anthurium amnicola TaxID=1678845 RepID=A0A1D1Y5B8_9ARAE